MTNYHQVRFHDSRGIPVRKAVSAILSFDTIEEYLSIKALLVEPYLPKLLPKIPKLLNLWQNHR
ncbi:MAG: hypothetical protein ACHQXG_05855 [Nitrososphaerales archaeon]